MLPTPTPAPDQHARHRRRACVDGLALVEHLNYDDNMATPDMKPGQPFTKGWRVKNTGTCTWDSGYTLVYAGGNRCGGRMGGEPVHVQGRWRPATTYDIEINLVAPLKPGTYQGFWQMENGKGTGLWRALAGRHPGCCPRPTATPAPTQTPVAASSLP